MGKGAEMSEKKSYDSVRVPLLGWAAAGLNACSKGVSQGLFQPTLREMNVEPAP
jgi:hypothetical protein